MLMMLMTTDAESVQQQEPTAPAAAAANARVYASASGDSLSRNIQRMQHVSKNATYSERACKN